ncbi:Glucose dehydrogenase [FAD, quinone] [Orchesella cincta]|uniref:Glucose dehydrogenase [FAD, quinone] n=1 Tax=Orchesella cincta TaxID=48709 RepID=A0A1D2ND86_ORCCI|nr:Glucose dehydrogenase [FAD, quinone] [Orchesella cincta]
MDIITSLGIGLGLHRTIGRFFPVYLGVTNVLPILLTLFLHIDRLTEYKQDEKVDVNVQYDFIIVGGGAAGCVLANRLSRYYKVLLIERGGNPNPLTFVPGLESLLLTHPETDYMFLTAPQNSSCLSCFQRRSLWNQGFGLGGSGVLNSMVYLRGHVYDYDLWSFYTRDKRWKFKNLLRYFLRSENYCYDCEKRATLQTPTNAKFHGVGGELPLMKPRDVPLMREFLAAMSWADVQIRDQNAPFYNSAANVAVYNQRNSRRSSTYTSFVEPVLHRTNLRIMRYARVIQVLFQPGKNLAYGIRYERFGKIGIIKAAKEVILSSGAINSPKILLLSGIGPDNHLKNHKIPVRLKLPVGENLQDHVGTLVGPILIDKPLSYIFERDTNLTSVLQFLQNGTGPLTLPFPVGNAFWSSTRAIMAGEGDWPDIQVGFSPQGVSEGLAESLSRNFNLREDVLDEFLSPVVGRDAFFLIVDYGRPKSRGTIRLKSVDFRDDVIIDPKYYEDRNGEDIKVTVEALQKTAYIAENAPVFKALGARLSPVPFPSCKDTEFRSYEYWECVARNLVLTLHHYTGTCSMGPSNSPETVVDSELRVVGTKGLRVVDASIMPFVTTANTHAPTIMIAERAADFILDFWRNRASWHGPRYVVKSKSP